MSMADAPSAGPAGFPLSFAHALVAVIVGTVGMMYIRLRIRRQEQLTEAPPARIFVPRAYTVEELAEYDGVRNPLSFVGVKGIIYNCAKEWYGADAPYNAFAGRDASRHLGKVVVGREESNADWTTLSPDHLHTLGEWEDRFRVKYIAVGWLIPPKDFESRAKAFQQ